MTTYTEDTAATTITLMDGESLSGQADYLEVQTADADRVTVYIDNSTVGGDPETHDLHLDAYFDNAAVTGWRRDVEETGRTGHKVTVEPAGERLRLDLVCQSGLTTGTDYRIYVESAVEVTNVR